MRLLNSLAIAISMYSKIPVPTVDWNEKNIKYAMCFFPVVGVITGILQFGIGYALLEYTSCGKFFFAAVMVSDSCSGHGRHSSGRVCGYDRCDQFIWRQRKETADTQRSAYGSICRDRAVCLFCGGTGAVE